MSNFNFNKVTLGGRLTADVELKTTPSGISVCSFIVAVNRKPIKDKEQQTDFISCVAWRQTAEFISKYFHKASSICIVGSIQTRNWTDQNGQKRYATEVIVDEAFFVDAKGEAGGTSAPAQRTEPAFAPASQYVPEQYQTQGAPQMQELGDDEELPF